MKTETIETSTSSAALQDITSRLTAARQRVATTSAHATDVFRDVEVTDGAEAERWRGEARTYEPGFVSALLYKAIRRVVMAEGALRAALGEARAVHDEGEAALIAARASVQEIRGSAVTPRALAEAGELERLARELSIALGTSEDDTLAPAGRLAALVAAALPRAVAGVLRVLREQRAARAALQLGELRRRAESIRSVWPEEGKLEALAVEVEASSGQRLAVPALIWSDDLLAAPTLTDG